MSCRARSGIGAWLCLSATPCLAVIVSSRSDPSELGAPVYWTWALTDQLRFVIGCGISAGVQLSAYLRANGAIPRHSGSSLGRTGFQHRLSAFTILSAMRLRP